MTGLDSLADRRKARCLSFSLKCTKDTYNARFFPRNPNLDHTLEARKREEFKVNFCRTKQYLNSAIPYCQRLLNEYFTLLEDQEEQEEEQEEEEEAVDRR